MEQSDEKTKLRKYILGSISDEDRSAIEERLLTDETFFEELSMTEEGLIQDYVDEDLNPPERAHFEKCFLHSEENRQKVKFARALRKYVNETEKTEQPQKKPNFFSSLIAFFSAPVPIALTVLAVAAIAGFFVWKSSDNRSEVLVALNKAYKTERPIESRISDFDYAPTKNTRGEGDKTNKTEFELAKILAIKALNETPNAQNLHALGQVYVTEKEFDKAIEQLTKAVKTAPDNAKIHNDLGVALMEKAKLQTEGKLEILGKALKELTRATELDKNLPDAHFNLALCLQAMPGSPQAKEAWQKYLELDSTTQWAEEARKNLQILASQINQDLSADELEKEFFIAFRQKNDEEAFLLISQTRELIKEKYLPQRLANSLLNASGQEKSEKVQALNYLGQLEKERIQDNFASDISDFYANISIEEIEILKKAQEAVLGGYKFCLDNDFSKALVKFNLAKDLFIKAGNFIEANTICQHFIAYCLYNTDKKTESIKLFTQVDEFCKKKSYKWLYLMNLYWFIGWNHGSSDYKSITKVKEDYERGFDISQKIQDVYMMQKYLIALAYRCFLIKQKSKMLGYLEEVFELSKYPKASLRQKFRNFSDSVEMLSITNLHELSKVIVLEELNIAMESKDIAFISYSLLDAGIVHTESDDFDKAKSLFGEAEQNTEKIEEESERKALLAQIFLQQGNLERRQENYQQSAGLYDKSIAILQTLKTPEFLYETQKSRLLAYQALNNDDEVEKQIPYVLELAEKYRDKILEEQERHSFFDNEQTVYDIAVEHNFRLGKNEQAYNYSEISNSRSLLDWLKRGANVSEKGNSLKILFNESEKPLSLKDIRNKMPSNVQILQYTVLENKILIWLISKEKFIVVSSEIKSDILKNKIEDYLVLIQSSNQEKQYESRTIGQELYKYLLSPILPDLDFEKEICVIPNKILFQLPFSSLISPNGDYFLSEFTYFYSPSANVFLISTENAQEKLNSPNENLLSVGNPKFDSQKFDTLQNLPNAEMEAKEIAHYYDNPQILLGKEATKNNFQNYYKNADVIHFAGHYIVQEGSPLDSGLVLADEGNSKDESILTNSELLAGKLSGTKLVVLSACQTGFEGYYNGEGLIGLSRTFLSSGVPLIVASQWKVDSEATEILMKNFHRYRRQEKLSTTNSLRQAQLDMINQPHGKYNLPYYWAAFSALGGYANF